MSKKIFVYTGGETLEALTEAVNYNKFLISLITKEIRATDAKNILDFGAGVGTYAQMLVDAGHTPDCLEPDKKQQAHLKKNGFKVISGSKDIKPNSYDIIYSLNVFEHIDDDYAEIKVLKKALKKGGRLIIYVPAYQVLFSELDRQVEHFRRYRTSRLRDMANSAELNIRELSYFDPIGFAAALVYKVGPNDGVLKHGPVKVYDRLVFPISKKLHPLSRKFFGKNALLVAERV